MSRNKRTSEKDIALSTNEAASKYSPEVMCPSCKTNFSTGFVNISKTKKIDEIINKWLQINQQKEIKQHLNREKGFKK